MGLEEEIKKTKRKLHSLNIEVIPKMPVYKKIPKSWFLWGVGILFLSFLGYTGITKIPFSQPSTKTPVRSSTYNPPNGSDLYQRKTGDLSKIDPTPVKIVNTKKKKDLSKIKPIFEEIPIRNKYQTNLAENNIAAESPSRYSSRELEIYMTQGAKLSNLGRYDDALNYYDRALAIEPNNQKIRSSKGLALLRQGSSLQKKGKLDLGIEKFLDAKKFLTDKSPANTGLYTCYLDKGIDAFNTKSFRTSLVSFNNALRYQSNGAKAMELKGAALFYLNQINESKTWIDRALKQKETDFGYYYQGHIHFKLGNVIEGGNSWIKGRAIDPTGYCARPGKSTDIRKAQ